MPAEEVKKIESGDNCEELDTEYDELILFYDKVIKRFETFIPV